MSLYFKLLKITPSFLSFILLNKVPAVHQDNPYQHITSTKNRERGKKISKIFHVQEALGNEGTMMSMVIYFHAVREFYHLVCQQHSGLLPTHHYLHPTVSMHSRSKA